MPAYNGPVSWLRLYPRALGDAWHALPGPLRACHDPSPALDAEGAFTVTHARFPLAGLVVALAGMPPPGRDVALRLEVRAHEGRQIWERDFAGFRMLTVQSLTPGGLMAERMGALELLFRLAPEERALVYRQAGLRLCVGPLRIPLPSWCGPRVEARAWCEPEDGDVMRVRVSVSLPLFGELITYGGPLKALGGTPA